MSRVLILVEGQTEETFVRDTLAPHLWNFGVYCIPKLATTKRVKAGAHFKGGIVSYAKLKFDIQRLLEDKGAALVTSMIDYYGFSSIVPFRKKISGNNCFQLVKSVEKLFAEDIGHKRFSPYLQLHEFEALLFVDPVQLDKISHTSLSEQLEKTKAKFKSPEEINDNPETAPSKRILKVYPGYKKTTQGPLISRRIGLAKIRKECKHFDQWVLKLEKLNARP